MSLQAKDDAARLFFIIASSNFNKASSMTTTNLAVASPVFGVPAVKTQSSLNTYSNPFEALLKSGFNEIPLDLSNANLLTVLSAFESHKRKLSPKYTNSSLVYNIKILEEMYGCTIMPYHVSADFYVYFKNFLLERGKKPSTIQNYFDTLRSALNFAGMHKAQLSETYKDYKVESYEKTKISLSLSQLAHIYYFQIDGNKSRIKEVLNTYPLRGFSFANLKKVKDQFVLEANCSQRYSDAHRINKDCFDESGLIYKTIQQKTGSHARIDFSKHSLDKDIAIEILKKYDYTSPTANMNISNFNRYLHILCQAIGGEFLRPIKTENKINGEIVVETCPMWRLITSHTARRTFITHHVLRGKMSLPEIQKCSGHKDLRQISRYTVVEDE